MGCCGNKDDEGEPTDEEIEMVDSKEYGTPHQYDPTFKGPIHNRSCTDIICCILFIIFIIGSVAVSILGYSRGDPYRLIHPTDSSGKICGIGELKDKPYLFFFDLLQCARMGPNIINGCPTPQVCVEQCPNSSYVFLQTVAKEKFLGGIDKTARAKMICKYNVNATDGGDVTELVKKEDCAAYYVPSSPVVGRCVPSIFKDILDDMGSKLNTSDGMVLVNALNESITGNMLNNGTRFLAEFYKFKEYGELIFRDVSSSWYFILIGLFIAMLISLLWIILMRWLVGVMVWLTLVLFVGLFSFGTYYCYSQYYKLKGMNTEKEFGLSHAFTFNFSYYLTLYQTWLAFGCTSATLLIIFVIVLLFLIPRICIAIQLIKEGSRAIGTMSYTLLWPIIPFVLQVLVVIYWGSTAIYLASIGDAEYYTNTTTNETVNTAVTSNEVVQSVVERIPCSPGGGDTAAKVCEFVKYGGSRYTVYLQFYMLFMFFWMMNFVIALGQMTLAGAFASYYWAFDKSKDIPSAPLASSFYRAIRYHLGTLAFGSVLIAIVQLIRSVLEYLSRKLKGSENKVARFIVKCLSCCFWCLEKILKFINKNAYIMTAIYGRNFCSAAKDGFFLIMRNIVRTFVLDKVADFIMFISKLMVTGAIGIAAYYWFNSKINILPNFVPDLNYSLVPVVILLIGTFLIATSFFNVFSMAVDTLFLCFLEDLERNDGSPDKPYFMSTDLKKILKKSNKKPK
ncbi:choline transporter-like protein 2 [Haliotis rufescens]|uniref:choline transporter-like protein 2 n=1 Tax=Haliotis rufescens TaxID=6454 RepID=UPI00201E7701|nr:choline transporter-like protein 2 [Haliotis rufescens]